MCLTCSVDIFTDSEGTVMEKTAVTLTQIKAVVTVPDVQECPFSTTVMKAFTCILITKGNPAKSVHIHMF